MTNESKFVTVTERIEAFRKYCEKMHDRPGGSCGKQERCSVCSLKWLDLEAEEEKPLPCPFCGCRMIEEKRCDYGLVCAGCEYTTPFHKTITDAIAAHNRVAKAVKESEAKNG